MKDKVVLSERDKVNADADIRWFLGVTQSHLLSQAPELLEAMRQAAHKGKFDKVHQLAYNMRKETRTYAKMLSV